jgi:hypothetical protein
LSVRDRRRDLLRVRKKDFIETAMVVLDTKQISLIAADSQESLQKKPGQHHDEDEDPTAPPGFFQSDLFQKNHHVLKCFGNHLFGVHGCVVGVLRSTAILP